MTSRHLAAEVERWCLDHLPVPRCCCPPEQPSAECTVTAHRTAAEHVLAQVDPAEARELVQRQQRPLALARSQQSLLERVLGVEPSQRDYALAGAKVAR